MPLFIGDVHQIFNIYKRLIEQHENTIQVGDLGVGFRLYPSGEEDDQPPSGMMRQQKARFIRGNHDNPAACRKHSQWIEDGTVEDDMMFIGGATSIDKEYRHKGFDWWPNEEQTDDAFDLLMGAYAIAQPACMVTHDCPHSIIPHLHSHHWEDKTRTQLALQKMWEIHKPKVWVFGHHHKSFDQIIDGTRFVCVGELEVKEVNWSKEKIKCTGN